MRRLRIQKHYDHLVRYDFLFSVGPCNAMQTPDLSHIVLNTGLGQKAVADRKQILSALSSLEIISGQRPCVTKAKKSIDKLKLRQKMPIGCKVTLRGANAYLFLDRLVSRVLPLQAISRPHLYQRAESLAAASNEPGSSACSSNKEVSSISKRAVSGFGIAELRFSEEFSVN